jgi:hypothetical protein
MVTRVIALVEHPAGDVEDTGAGSRRRTPRVEQEETLL